MTTDFDDRFVAALRERGWSFEQLDDGIYLVELGGRVLTLSSRNIRAEVLRDGDDGVIGRFLDDVARTGQPLPPWPAAMAGLFPMIDSIDVQLTPEAVMRPLSEQARVVLVHHVQDTGTLRFVRASDLAAWGVTADEAWQHAEQSFRTIVAATRVELREAGGSLIGMLHAHEPYKASMILSPGLKGQIPAELGWPVYAVAPARDFVFLFRKDDEGILARLGAVVTREFRASGYPVSTEVWELSDAGVRAVGAFPQE